MIGFTNAPWWLLNTTESLLVIRALHTRCDRLDLVKAKRRWTEKKLSLLGVLFGHCDHHPGLCSRSQCQHHGWVHCCAFVSRIVAINSFHALTWIDLAKAKRRWTEKKSVHNRYAPLSLRCSFASHHHQVPSQRSVRLDMKLDAFWSHPIGSSSPRGGAGKRRDTRGLAMNAVTGL